MLNEAAARCTIVHFTRIDASAVTQGNNCCISRAAHGILSQDDIKNMSAKIFSRSLNKVVDNVIERREVKKGKYDFLPVVILKARIRRKL